METITINGETMSKYIPLKIMKTSPKLWSAVSGGICHFTSNEVNKLVEWVEDQNKGEWVVRPFKIVHIESI